MLLQYEPTGHVVVARLPVDRLPTVGRRLPDGYTTPRQEGRDKRNSAHAYDPMNRQQLQSITQFAPVAGTRCPAFQRLGRHRVEKPDVARPSIQDNSASTSVQHDSLSATTVQRYPAVPINAYRQWPCSRRPPSMRPSASACSPLTPCLGVERICCCLHARCDVWQL